MSDCIYCTNPARDHGSGIDSHRFTPEPTQFHHTRGPKFGEPIEPDACVWCDHPVDVHYDGGCQISAHSDEPMCGCGHDADFHPDPPRGDE